MERLKREEQEMRGARVKYEKEEREAELNAQFAAEAEAAELAVLARRKEEARQV